MDKVVFFWNVWLGPGFQQTQLIWVCLSPRHPKDIPACERGKRHSFLPLFCDYKLSPLLGMEDIVVKEADRVCPQKLSCWKLDVHALRMQGATCQSVCSLV